MTHRPSTLSDGTIRMDPQPQLPEVLDLLIVGGGPAGTAAALRAKENGARALVIDRDDLMSRIRDYSKDKLILPHYGGGDRVRFPKGGDLIAELPFPPIDKDEICRRWKDLYLAHSIPAQVGVELLGLEKTPEGWWRAKLHNHNTKSEEGRTAKHVVIAIGRGVPRTFDIPGNTMGIQYRLSDPDLFAQGPVCVIGGGTSAAEAVISISRAKARADDAAAVYWFYRGDKMPRVSKALNEEFFEAFVINGNIRYYPRSEPAAVVMAEDHQEYLAIRIDRRRLEGRPCETSHFEFPKEQCIACIGEDVPEKFLRGMGIEMAETEAGKRKLIVVNALLESQQSGVYLIGDILSQYYFCAGAFGEATGYERSKHPGNIKSSIRDGVYIADVIAERLRGGSGSDVVIEDAEEEGQAAPLELSMIESTPAAEVSRVALPELPPAALLTRILPGGVESDEYRVGGEGATTIGRRNCDLSFSDDALLSDRHASIVPVAEGFLLRDDASQNGTYLKLLPGQPHEVSKGDLLTLGRQFLVAGRDDQGCFVDQFDSAGQKKARHRVRPESQILGRQSPEITLDRADKSLSRRHAAVESADGRLRVTDLNSSNGTYLKVRDAVRLRHGDRFRVGQQLLQFSLAEAPAPVESAVTSTAPPSAEGVEAQVTFKPSGKVCPLSGRTVAEAAEECGLALDTECLMGLCGIDPIRILSGDKYLNPCGEAEAKSLKKKGLQPGKHRFACMARASGPIEVEVVG